MYAFKKTQGLREITSSGPGGDTFTMHGRRLSPGSDQEIT
jgi:hypothetical protein